MCVLYNTRNTIYNIKMYLTVKTYIYLITERSTEILFWYKTKLYSKLQTIRDQLRLLLREKKPL
jgi:hypothetical protein